MMARASSGSRSAISSVEPLMSANRAVTVFRSPSRLSRSGASVRRTSDSLDFFGGVAGACPSAAAHSPQKSSPGSFEAPHSGHNRASGPAHFAQNLRPSRLSAPHFSQRTLCPQLLEQRLRLFQVGSFESFGEPVIDFCEHRARLVATAGVAKQPREVRRRAEFEESGALPAGNTDRSVQAPLGFARATGVLYQKQI